MFVVTGATGNVGQALVRMLAEARLPVTAVARHITQADVPPEVRAVAADLAEPAGLGAAFEGGKALFLLVAGEDPHGILDAAKTAGIRKVVLLSTQGVGTRPEAYRHPALFEAAVQHSGLDWTVLRSGGMATNAFAWAESIRAGRRPRRRSVMSGCPSSTPPTWPRSPPPPCGRAPTSGPPTP